jgi:hypothetical protein
LIFAFGWKSTYQSKILNFNVSSTLLADVCISLDLTLFYSASFYSISFSCTTQIHKLKFESEYYLRINMWNRVKMQTPAITLWFPVHIFKDKFILGLFILQKQLAKQGIFLMKSKLSITANLFLALYGSTTLQSQLILKNIKNFLCK